jgi:hypothetical protein
VVTADGSAVVGRDARTGAEAWSYTRDIPLCAVGAGFPGADDGVGRVLALYEWHAGWCSELTELRPDDGARTATSNPDVKPGTRLLENGTFVAATGSRYLEVMRSDLVKTMEYGDVPTPVQVGRQPRPGCTYGSTALTTGRLGVLERCPDDPADRLTVLSPDGSEGAETPQVEFSVLLPKRGATLVALSADRVAVALPNPARLLILDRTGQQVAMINLDVPDADLAADPPGGVAAVTGDGSHLYWWTGSQTVALDAADLAPVWTVPHTLGPAVSYGGGLLVPVAAGLLDVDPDRGSTVRTIPVARDDRTAPVRLAPIGEMLLEQRGPEVVALQPAP